MYLVFFGTFRCREDLFPLSLPCWFIRAHWRYFVDLPPTSVAGLVLFFSSYPWHDRSVFLYEMESPFLLRLFSLDVLPFFRPPRPRRRATASISSR